MTTAQFLIDHVGERYFQDHYTLKQEQVVGTNLVKAAYHYTYQPHVQGYPLTLFFDPTQGMLSDTEVSRVLLEPQAFEVSPEEAKTIALENGLDPTGGSYAVNLVLGPMTHNRFAWEVINSNASPTAEAPKPIFRVVLDVEGGNVYAAEELGLMESHGSPTE